jgi:hypothetical protein
MRDELLASQRETYARVMGRVALDLPGAMYDLPTDRLRQLAE